MFPFVAIICTGVGARYAVASKNIHASKCVDVKKITNIWYADVLRRRLPLQPSQ